MATVVFDGLIQAQKPLLIPVSLQIEGQGAVDCMGMIDTASHQCIVNAGVLDREWFGESPNQDVMQDALGNKHQSRFAEMTIRLQSNGKMASFIVPVFEMPLGSFPAGTPIMLIGRSLLSYSRFVYDGLDAKWNIMFESEE